LGLERLVPPPVGAFAGRSGTWFDRGRGRGRGSGQRSRLQRSAFLVGDHEVLGGSGDGDDAPMVGPVVIGAHQRVSHESEVLGRAAR
jgi:hypothetical protein